MYICIYTYIHKYIYIHTYIHIQGDSLIKFDIPWSTRVQSAYLSQPSAINTVENTKNNSTNTDLKGMGT
jgi:hypothetical protein